MSEFFLDSTFFALVVSLAGFELGRFLKQKTGLALFNPLLIGIVTVIVLLLIFRIDYGTYEQGSSILTYMLTPATVALAVPLYRQVDLLKKYSISIFLSILSGVLTSLFTTLLMAVVLKLTHVEYVTFLPKSITTPIGMEMSEELGGLATITVAVIVTTGIVGNALCEQVCKIFRIKDKIAIGLALGTSSHVLGTAKALELGEVEGAMSSLSIVVSGVLTVAGANIFAMLY